MYKWQRDSGGGDNESFDPIAFYREQQQAMLSQAAHHVEQSRDEITRAQQEQDAESGRVDDGIFFNLKVDQKRL